MNGLALCAGIGGLELGLARAVGERYRTVAIVERSAEAAALLADKMEAGILAQAPIWDDVKTFDGRRWRGIVDIVSAGFPCQPFSMAGRRRGVEDERHLWPHIARIIAECQPTLVFLENVPGLLTTLTPDGRYAYEHVEGDLRELGFSVEAGIFSAAEVGAPHNRERIFLLAHSSHERHAIRQAQRREGQDRARRNSLRDQLSGQSRELADAGRGGDKRRREPGVMGSPQSPQQGETRQQRDGNTTSDGVPDVGDTRHGPRSTELWQQHEVPPAVTGRAGEDVGNTNGRGRWPEGDEELAPEQPHQAISQFPPGPADDWSDIPERLWPAVEPGFRDVADGLAGRVAALSRSQELRILGNGVVPQTAELAFRVLNKRSGLT